MSLGKFISISVTRNLIIYPVELNLINFQEKKWARIVVMRTKRKSEEREEKGKRGKGNNVEDVIRR